MPAAPKIIEEATTRILQAWETLAADKTFAGMSLAQFKTKVKPSFDARETIAALEQQLTAALNQRDDADRETQRLTSLVVNAVKGDPEFGEDSDLYEAMGYVRKSERKTGLTRKKPATATKP